MRLVAVCVSGVVVASLMAGCAATNNAVTQSQQGSTSTIYVDAAGKCASLTPCVTDLPSGVAVAKDGDIVSVFDGSYSLSSADPTTPALVINKSLTITSYDAQQADDNCPQVVADCPSFTVAGAINTPIVITADSVAINNLSINQKDVPGSDPVSAIIHVPTDASSDKLVAGTQLAELALTGARRGVWYSGSNGSISTSVFASQLRDSIFVPASTTALNIFGNTFSGDAAKAVLFENQVGSPATSGIVSLSYNAQYGKGNFAVWNSWAAGVTANSVSYSLDHNTIVGTSGAAAAILPGSPSPGFAMFSTLSFTNNIVQQAGNDAFFVDYTYSPNPAAAPGKGQIVVTNTDTYNNKASSGTNDPSGNYGYSAGAPSGATIGMYNLNGKNLNNTNPLLVSPAALDFSLQSKSPAIGAGTNGSNIGQWQGIRPVVRRVQPACAKAGDSVVVVATNVKNKPTVAFGTANATVTDFKAKKKSRITVTVPSGSPGSFVDVSVTTSDGTGTLPRGFHYPDSSGKC